MSMSQERFNNLTLLHTHKLRTDSLDTTDVAMNFDERNESRKKKFGKFYQMVVNVPVA